MAKAKAQPLSQLLQSSRLAYQLHIPAETDVVDPLISSVVEDSREALAGTLFCCVSGESLDGHDFAPQAAEAGSLALVVERPLPLRLPQVLVANSRAAIGPLALAHEGSPQQHLELAAVTGTNGKTTVAYLLESILSETGRCCFVSGTLSGSLTTPRPVDLAGRLAAALADGADAVVLEISSHGLAQQRVEGLQFAVSGFTNLSVDHLDYHRDMEQYFKAKCRLFEAERTAVSVVCTDDCWGKRLAASAVGEVHSCSIDDAEMLEMTMKASRFRWRQVEISLPLGGMHNVVNAVVAATMAEAMGAQPAEIAAGLRQAPQLPGRFEVVAESPAAVIVDFAHSPASLEQLLRAGRTLAPLQARLSVVFGCGGERDEGKREEMGAIAARLADRVIITSDNPRGEDPERIAAAVLAGARHEATEVELDRRRAIASALVGARAGDVVIVAGKGHETEQIIGGQSFPFDDRAVVRELLSSLSETGLAL